MALIDKKITVYVDNIVDLSDRPNENGITANQLKAMFDGRSDKELKTSLNGIVDDLVSKNDGASGADQVGSTALKSGGAETVQGQLEEVNGTLTSHTTNVSNPHTVTKTQVGLGNVDNVQQATKSEFNEFVARTDNPHGVTSEQVGAYSKTQVETSGSAAIHWGNLTNVPNLADASWKASVANRAALPLTGNSLSDQRVVLDDGDGKQAVYLCIAITGDVDAQWEKIADVDWNTDEATRVAQESARVIAEGLRVTAETSRTGVESARVSAESGRSSAEGLRVTAETNRGSAEGLRVTAETGRSNAEINRVSAESTRVQAENARNVYENYNPNIAYINGNKVVYQGSSYLNITPCINVPPINTSYWRMIVQKGTPGTSLNLTVRKQYETYEDLPTTEDMGYMCLVGLELHIFTENGWVNAGKLTEIDYDLFMNIDGGLFTDEGGVIIGESGLEALQNHIIDVNTHDNLIVDGMEV